MEVICNSGPLITLGKLNLLHLLKRLYGYVAIATGVYKESVIIGKKRGHQDALNIELFLKQNNWKPIKLNWEEIDGKLKALMEVPQVKIVKMLVNIGKKHIFPFQGLYLSIFAPL